jgi:hypothetical protein
MSCRRNRKKLGYPFNYSKNYRLKSIHLFCFGFFKIA